RPKRCLSRPLQERREAAALARTAAARPPPGRLVQRMEGGKSADPVAALRKSDRGGRSSRPEEAAVDPALRGLGCAAPGGVRRALLQLGHHLARKEAHAALGLVVGHAGVTEDADEVAVARPCADVQDLLVALLGGLVSGAQLRERWDSRGPPAGRRRGAVA